MITKNTTDNPKQHLSPDGRFIVQEGDNKLLIIHNIDSRTLFLKNISKKLDLIRWSSNSKLIAFAIKDINLVEVCIYSQDHIFTSLIRIKETFFDISNIYFHDHTLIIFDKLAYETKIINLETQRILLVHSPKFPDDRSLLYFDYIDPSYIIMLRRVNYQDFISLISTAEHQQVYNFNPTRPSVKEDSQKSKFRMFLRRGVGDQPNKNIYQLPGVTQEHHRRQDLDQDVQGRLNTDIVHLVSLNATSIAALDCSVDLGYPDILVFTIFGVLKNIFRSCLFKAPLMEFINPANLGTGMVVVDKIGFVYYIDTLTERVFSICLQIPMKLTSEENLSEYFVLYKENSNGDMKISGLPLAVDKLDEKEKFRIFKTLIGGNRDFNLKTTNGGGLLFFVSEINPKYMFVIDCQLFKILSIVVFREEIIGLDIDLGTALVSLPGGKVFIWSRDGVYKTSFFGEQSGNNITGGKGSNSIVEVEEINWKNGYIYYSTKTEIYLTKIGLDDIRN